LVTLPFTPWDPAWGVSTSPPACTVPRSILYYTIKGVTNYEQGSLPWSNKNLKPEKYDTTSRSQFPPHLEYYRRIQSHFYYGSLLGGGPPQPLCYWSNQPSRMILNHSLVASLHPMIAVDHTAYMPRLKGGGPKHTTAEQTDLTRTSSHDITPYQGLDKRTPNSPPICLTRPVSTLKWTPKPFIPVDNRPMHPFSQLVNNLGTSIIKAFSKGSQSNIIAHLQRMPNICVMVGDFQELISHGPPINHELLTLSLEVICSQHGTKYLEPAFFTMLRSQGWPSVRCWFTTSSISQPGQPNLADKHISIPIHINGNHWVGLHI